MNRSPGIFLMLIILILFSFYSCDKINYYPNKESEYVKTLILAHRAGGGSTSIYQQNSLEAARYGLSIVDGIEVDIELSKDRTIWLSHGAELIDCDGILSYDCFPEVFDNQIIELDSCNGDLFNYTRLEDIFALMSSSYPGKYISLDVQLWYPCAYTSLDILGIMIVIADEIIRLTEKYNLQNYVMVESWTTPFLDHVKNNSTGIECYLTSYGDFERAMLISLSNGYTGISFKYKFKEEITIEHIELIRQKGLKIQLWTVNSAGDINEALSINPDYIQTDNFTYFEQLN